ncbi:MAG: DNA recombination protein RmuC [Flavobacteriales bacterium]|jgi:DNA recombination protein RmuC|nr:DNA recombination protein RmuC [Flavobacteriales bacterium]
MQIPLYLWVILAILVNLIFILIGLLVKKNKQIKQLSESKQSAELAVLSAQKELQDVQQNLKNLEYSMGLEAKHLNEKLEQFSFENKNLREINAHLEKNRNELDIAFQTLQNKQKDLLVQREALQKQMQNHFENIAQKIFKEREKDWKEDNFGSFQKMIQPFNEKLQAFEKNVTTQRVEQNKLSGELKGELNKLMQLNQDISKEAKQLTSALKGDNKLQGNWGEYQLETLLQGAGLHENTHYTKQNNFLHDGERKIPDFILNLPENKCIVLDAKVSLKAYEKYVNADTEIAQNIALKEHLLSIRNHIKNLSSKKYHLISELKTVDYTFLFVAVEPALFLAANEDTYLYDFALKHDIVLLSHSTLLATLRTIAHIWKQEDQQKNAQKIAEYARKIYNQIAAFVEEIEKAERQLDALKKTHQGMRTKLKGRQGVITQINKMRDLGVSNTKPISMQYEEEYDEEEPQ